MPKNIDRTTLDESFDLEPLKVNNIFQSANAGNVKRQSRLANELTEKDPAIAQAWSVRVASIASCPWEIVGGAEDRRNRIMSILESIRPQYDTGLVSFNKFLQFLQTAVLHGFSVSETEYVDGGTNIDGFRLYSQSLFSFVESSLPVYEDEDGTKRTPTFPRWVYHTANNSREAEPLRSGIVRPLAYLYAIRRHFMIQYARGVEKYGMPTIIAEVDDFFYEDNEQRQKVEQMLLDFTYDGSMVVQKDTMELKFTDAAGFDANVYETYLASSEKQIFRIILGQDSTSSADNSNRSTAQVHNLVRADMLASDANAVEGTINDQIIKPLVEAIWGDTADMPLFRFRLKGVSELNEYATLAKTIKDAGLSLDLEELSDRMGMNISNLLSNNEES